VAHTYNSSYSGGRDQENHNLKPARQIVQETLSWKNPSQKRVGGVAQSMSPEFKNPVPKKEIKKKKKEAATLKSSPYLVSNLSHHFLSMCTHAYYLPNLSLLLRSAPLLNSKLRHSTFLKGK
jgi:hypothetical protein